MIVLNAVNKSYGSIRVLDNVDIEVPRGEFVAIVGPSGSGKTTLLNVMAGLLSPTTGKVSMDGAHIYEMKAPERISFRRKHFGFVFQAFNLLPYFTVRQNLEVPMYLCGVSAERQETAANELLRQVGLLGKGDKLPSVLSAGEQQRVVIARALANKPEVIFADEPTGNLDSENARKVMRLLKDLNETGITVLLVTHDAEMGEFARK